MTNAQWGVRLRADRLVTLYLSSPFCRLLAPHSQLSVPILMYHSISESTVDRRHPYFSTTTSPRVFADQVNYLSENGYRGVTLNEAVQYLEGGKQDGQRRVVITFDDGFRDFYVSAFPVLQRHRFTATVFLPTQYVADRRRSFKSWDCMTWSEVQEMCDAGISFGSHTVSHGQLRALSDSEIVRELRESRETIENMLGRAVDSFSYPFAFPEADHAFKERLKTMLAEQGYRTGVTTIIGSAYGRNDRLFLPRLPVNSWDDLPLFCAKLAGAYDWMHFLQWMNKMVKA